MASDAPPAEPGSREPGRDAMLVSGQNRALQAIVSGEPIATVLEHLVHTVEKGAAGGAVIAGILLVDRKGNCLRHGAAPSLPDDYNRAIDGVPVSPDIGTCARAAAINQVVVTPDIASDPGWTAIKHLPLGLGLRAAWSMPIVSAQGEVLGTFGTYFRECRGPSQQERDIVAVLCKTAAIAIERHRASERLEQLVAERTASLQAAIAQMEEFSYSVSHDLRSPVRAMRGYAEALLQDHGSSLSGEARELVHRIEHNGQRMDRLIQDVLTYSRVARREIRLERVSLERLVREVIRQYPELHPSRAHIVVAEGLPEVWAHEPSLTQVVSNLLSNAVKFVGSGVKPRVRIAHQATGGMVRLCIEDNGIGIPPEVQPKLFGMFERAHPSLPYEGTGIGLAIVRKAIERMNGRVGVDSDGTSGSRFWVELPAPAI